MVKFINILSMNLDSLLGLLNEIDDSNQKEKQSLESYLERLIENIFKLQYWELEQGRDYQYWKTAVLNSRNAIKQIIRNNLSLIEYMEQIYPKVYQNAVKVGKSEFYIPENTSIRLEQILDKNYFG